MVFFDNDILIHIAGLFMALQPRIIACGTKRATIGMVIRFLCGPIIMSAASVAVGLRGVKLHAAIVQVLYHDKHKCRRYMHACFMYMH